MSTAPITMPADLQAKMKNRNFSWEQKATAASFETDTGPTKLRQRTTRPRRFYRSPVQLTDSEITQLRTFFDDTANGGTSPFNFTDPVDNVEKVFQFRNASLPTFKEETPGAVGNKTYTFTLILELVYGA